MLKEILIWFLKKVIGVLNPNLLLFFSFMPYPTLLEKICQPLAIVFTGSESDSYC
jgi:hypothetical protein